MQMRFKGVEPQKSISWALKKSEIAMLMKNKQANPCESGDKCEKKEKD